MTAGDLRKEENVQKDCLSRTIGCHRLALRVLVVHGHLEVEFRPRDGVLDDIRILTRVDIRAIDTRAANLWSRLAVQRAR